MLLVPVVALASVDKHGKHGSKKLMVKPGMVRENRTVIKHARRSRGDEEYNGEQQFGATRV